jgi:predicted nucleotidyltransferase component of viral defense system
MLLNWAGLRVLFSHTGEAMISANEVKEFSIQFGVPLPNVEKDYVMGWLLWGIYNDTMLSQNLVLKGGNCLRKLYFPDTRFSDDLDFTAYRLNTEQEFHKHLDSICQRVEQVSGIVFDISQTRVEQKQTPDKDCNALDGRLYFRGFAGDDSVTMRIKFDVSEYERIVLPTQRHLITHNYSDQAACSAEVLAYSLEEILAEKLRSWIQRTRSRDLFDVVKIVQSEMVPISKRNILTAFIQKTIFKDIPLASRDEMLYEPKFNRIEQDWMQTIICPANSAILVTNAIALFRGFIEALYDPNLLQAIGLSSRPMNKYSYNIRSGVREAIIEAGQARQLIRMRYHNRDRNIEPYSFRYKFVKAKGYGAEYFFGFDRTKDQSIKRFFLHEIQGVSILPDKFLPRWSVEF